LKKHRSIIFQNVPIDASKSLANASIQRLGTGRKKKKKKSGTSEENSAALTTSVCLPSGAVVQIPVSLMQSTSHTKLQEKKRGKRSPPSDNHLGRMKERDVLYSTSKRKGLCETDTQQSFKSSRKRGRFNRKGQTRTGRNRTDGWWCCIRILASCSIPILLWSGFLRVQF